ncbi:MAG TPA: DSD1 family PLP-dependent enzyme, partial [Bacillota bacterium]|nr:DSD1 family PLP-dependent enzyme [Bacillota bacterium]
TFIGQLADTIPTPAPVVDLDRLEQNLRQLAGYFGARACKLRPHFKSHKCVELARRQVAAGACVGITCAKLAEAEQLAAGGIQDILIANQVVGADKARRLAALNGRAIVRCAVDSPANARQLATAATEAGVVIPVLIEVDIGMRRCGVAPGAPTLALAQEIGRLPGLRLDGLQAYEGHLVTLPDLEERRRRVGEAFAPVLQTRRQLEVAGLVVPILSGGGTGTYDITGNLDGVDEVQCGSYALMDWSYARIRPEFVVARWIQATVVSAHPDYAVVDVGTKGLGCEFGPPILAGCPEAKARSTAEEHTSFDGLKAEVGQKVRLIPSHGCTTQNLHRRLWLTRGGKIVDVWPIEGAGCLE